MCRLPFPNIQHSVYIFTHGCTVPVLPLSSSVSLSLVHSHSLRLDMCHPKHSNRTHARIIIPARLGTYTMLYSMYTQSTLLSSSSSIVVDIRRSVVLYIRGSAYVCGCVCVPSTRPEAGFRRALEVFPGFAIAVLQGGPLQLKPKC